MLYFPLLSTSLCSLSLPLTFFSLSFLALRLLLSPPLSLSPCCRPLLHSPPPPAVLGQWCEELGRLMLLRHQNRTRQMEVGRNQSQTAAMEIAKAAALYAANQHMQRPYGAR